ncbi:MAG: GerMN domain-containing protein [Candidatus Pacebacteria bacterium]|nr:GerMN domain-containing protein [Candidatus Paceibacterota bacterium]
MTNKSLVITIGVLIFALAAFILLNLEDPGELEVDPTEKAEQWVEEEATTFLERGGSDLEFQDATEVSDGVYEVTFNFESTFAGYGEVSDDEMSAQVITPHTIVVTVEDGSVVGAVTDDTYDEMEEKMIGEEEEIEGEEGDVLVEPAFLNLYFVTVEEGQEKVEAVGRMFVMEEGVEEEVVNALLEGPTTEEEEEGYSTAIDSEATLNSFRIEEKTAYADFSEELDASGSAMVMAIREQIEKTLLQFESVDDVVISINGETEEVLQP